MSQTNKAKIAQLEGLLARIRANASAPRPARALFGAAALDERGDGDGFGSSGEIARGTVGAGERIEADASGEYPSGDVALELEELGPADEFEGETVIEITVDAPPPEDDRAARATQTRRVDVASYAGFAARGAEHEEGGAATEVAQLPPELGQITDVSALGPLTDAAGLQPFTAAPSAKLQTEAHYAAAEPQAPGVERPHPPEDAGPPEPMVVGAFPVEEPAHAESATQRSAGRASEPPSSRRELVAAPWESARIAVATPSASEEVSLDGATGEHPTGFAASAEVPAPAEAHELDRLEHVEQEQAAQPESRRGAPALTGHPISAEVSIPRGRGEEAQTPSPAPATAARAEEVPFEDRARPDEAVVAPVQAPGATLEPERVAQGVVLRALGVEVAHAARAIESVVVAIDADVIRPGVTPADVAAFVGAAREPRPETFGALLDAALDL